MLFTILVSVALVGFDQLIKFLAVKYLADGTIVTVIPRVLDLRYVENDGAAFSILAGRQGILIAVTSITLLVIAYFLFFRRPKQKMEYAALLLIFAGGAGNLVNRIAQGYVVDYFNVLFMRFAVFNMADIFVTVGVALFIVSILYTEIKQRKNKNTPLEETPAGGQPDGKD